MLYKDGTKKRVENGILFEETEDHKLNIHIGTDNQVNMLIAIICAAGDMINRVSAGSIRIELNKTV